MITTATNARSLTKSQKEKSRTLIACAVFLLSNLLNKRSANTLAYEKGNKREITFHKDRAKSNFHIE